MERPQYKTLTPLPSFANFAPVTPNQKQQKQQQQQQQKQAMNSFVLFLLALVAASATATSLRNEIKVQTESLLGAPSDTHVHSHIETVQLISLVYRILSRK